MVPKLEVLANTKAKAECDRLFTAILDEYIEREIRDDRYLTILQSTYHPYSLWLYEEEGLYSKTTQNKPASFYKGRAYFFFDLLLDQCD